MDKVLLLESYIDLSTWKPDSYLDDNPKLKIIVSKPHTIFYPTNANLQFFLDLDFEGIFVIKFKQRTCEHEGTKPRYELIYEVYIFLNGKREFLHAALCQTNEEKFIHHDREMYLMRYNTCRRNFQCNQCRFLHHGGALRCAVNPLFVMNNYVCKDKELKIN